MRWLKRILIVLGILVIVILAWGVINFLWMYTPSTGSKIAEYQTPQSALLVVDVQEDTTGPASKMLDSTKSEPLISNVNQIIETANLLKMPVIYIGQEFNNDFISRALLDNKLIKGRPGTKLDARLKMVNSVYFPKLRSDAFSNPALERYLIENQIQKIYIVGVDAVYCVYKTAVGGVNRDYDVTIVSDAIATGTKKTSAEILEMYKKDRISTMSSDDFLHLKMSVGTGNE